MSKAAKVNAQGVVENVIVVGDYIPEGYQLCNDWIGIGMNVNAPEPTPPLPSNDEQSAKRKAAYTEEADPIFFMAQRGEATTEEWQAKINEIKERYPYYFDDQGNLIEAQ
jgi:hypothetical protein